MELSDLHNPTCKLHASQSFEDHSPIRERRHSDTVSDIFLSPEAYKATQAVEFIAEHLRNEDEYVQVNTIGNTQQFSQTHSSICRLKYFSSNFLSTKMDYHYQALLR